MNKNSSHGIRFKMVVYFGILFVMTGFAIELGRFFGIPFIHFKGQRDAVTEAVFRNFSIVADLQKEHILDWMEERKDDIGLWLENTRSIERLGEVRQVLRTLKEQGKSGDEMWPSLLKEKSYAELTDSLARIKNVNGVFEELLIIDRDSGITIASTNREHVGKKNPAAGVLPKEIGPDEFFVGVSNRSSDQNKLDLVTTRLALSGETAQGGERKEDWFLAGIIRLENSVLPMLPTAQGLGKTGEVVLVNQDLKILLPLKYPMKGGVIAIPLKTENNAEPARRAARGEEGIIESLDYRGVPVLAAYRYLPFSSKTGWGMVVKCDRSEIFRYLNSSRNYSLVINLLGILAGISLIFWLASRIAYPIKQITEVARQVEHGNFSARADERSRDEIGFLAVSFNQMIQRISGWKAELEQQVQSRTAEFSAVNQQLRASEQQLQAANQQLRASQQQLRAINQQLIANEQQLRTEAEVRKRSEEELRKHVNELQVFYKSSIGREERILELKNKIAELETELKKR